MPKPPPAPLFTGPGEARAYLESLRWPEEPVCLHCGAAGRCRRFQPRAGTRLRPGVWKCGACRKQFTVTVNTVFQDTNLPLETWLTALARLRATRRGVTARDLQKELGITYKSAWRVIDLACYAMNRPKRPAAGVGENAPVSFYPAPLFSLVRQCLRTLPKRKHPDATQRADERLEQRRKQRG